MDINIASLKESAVYCGNPAHKKNPGDFGLTPPSAPHPAKSLCDVAKIFRKEVAGKLLREGIGRGLISRQFRGDWPQKVWAVTENGDVLEAQLENRMTGAYHGYPLPPTDPFAELVLREWEARQP
ncbi:MULTISPECIES: hypothetical protein [Alloalcanivorax]|uniref:hypothetical protein n=1 Tax=Alloalcanivorax TaxID=3020832 RepID=UPI001F0DC2F6|nr:hypothetical protein [Alloalcanivorax gelatiniphagus]